MTPERQNIRRMNLVRAVHGRALSPHDLAVKFGGSERFWADLKNGKEPFDAGLARKIEAALFLPAGWLECVSGSPLPPDERPAKLPVDVRTRSSNVLQFRARQKIDSGNFDTLLRNRRVDKK
jgi:hypothetical protein